MPELANVARLSVRTIEYLEAGERRRYHVATLTKIETAFGWKAGSALRVVDGAAPRPEPDPALAKVTDAWPLLGVSERDVVAALVDTLIPKSRRG